MKSENGCAVAYDELLGEVEVLNEINAKLKADLKVALADLEAANAKLKAIYIELIDRNLEMLGVE